MRDRAKRIRYPLFTLLDALSVALSFNLAFVLFEILEWQSFTQIDATYSAVLLIVLTCISHLSVGLYEHKVRENIRQVLRRATLSAGLVFLAYQALLIPTTISPHNLTIVSGLLLSVALQATWRYWLVFTGSAGWAKRNVVFIGAGERAAFICRRMRRDVDRKNFSGWNFIDLGQCNKQLGVKESVIPVDPDGLKSTILRLSPDVVVLANDRKEKFGVSELLDVKMLGVEVVEFEDFIEAELGQIAVERMRPEWLLVSKGYNLSRFAFEKVNYCFNAFLALVVLLLTFPMMLLAMFAIYLDDGRRDKASFLYKQVRVGLNGHKFEIMKFRSMGKNAEKDGAQWAQENDVRVTRVGHYLRKYRIDELPQLFNVLRGEMCFVGPRPERPEFITELSQSIPFFDYRHAVKPGLTGWAQISYPYGASTKDSFEKLKYDLYYIKHKSFMLDIFVLLRTVEIVLFGKGR